MATGDGDLDLLLSLRDDRVPETPPASPSSHPSRSSGYNSDDASPKRARGADMSVFRDAVKDYLHTTEPRTADPTPLVPNKARKSNEVEVEKFSGLRIRNSLVSSLELRNRLSDMRFVRLTAIRNLLSGDTLSGCWATIGVLTEIGASKLSSAGKNYCVWKMSCLDQSNVSVFLFGDAYARNAKELIGSVFVLFNSAVRKDAMGGGFSLSLYSAGQLLKIGTSSDYGICKGKRKDGIACTMVINRCQGVYCKYHISRASQKYSTMRSELKGGNLQRLYRCQPEGVYMVDPLSNRPNSSKSVQKAKVLSVDGLKKVLSNAGKVTTNSHSQGVRFLTQVTATMHPKVAREVHVKHNQLKDFSKKRPISTTRVVHNAEKENMQPDAKRNKNQHSSGNMIELDIVSSDEDIGL